MKQIGKRLTLAVVLLLSFVLMLMGVISLCPVNAEEETNKPEQVKSDWFELVYDDDSLEFRLSGDFRSYLDANRGDISELRSGIVQAVKRIVMKGIFSNQMNAASGAQALSVRADTDIPAIPGVDLDNFDWGSGNLRDFKDYIVDRLSEPSELEKYVKGEYDTLLDYAISEYVGSQDTSTEELKEEVYGKIHDKMDQVMDEVLDKFEEKFVEQCEEQIQQEFEKLKDNEEYKDKTEEELKELAQQAAKDAWFEEKEINPADPAQSMKDKVNERVEYVEENGGSVSLSVDDLIGALDIVKVDGATVFESGSLSFGGIKHVLTLLPRPATLAEYTDEQMANILKDIDVDLTTTYGDVNFKVSFGFYGNTNVIRKAAKAIAKVIDVTGNSQDLHVTLNPPAAFTKLMKVAVESAQFTDAQKNHIFSLFGMTVSEMYDKATSYELSEIVDFLKGLDYAKFLNSAISADFLNEYFGSYLESLLGHPITDMDATVDKFIDKVHDYFVKFEGRLETLTVEQVENWLKKLPGFGEVNVPEKLERAAQKLLDFAKRIDWAKYDAAYIRDILANNPEAFNGEIVKYLEDFGMTFDEYYGTFLNYVEKLYNNIPERLKDGSLTGIYQGAGAFAYEGTFNFDLANVFGRIANFFRNRGFEGVGDFLDKAAGSFSGERSLHLTLNATVPNLYKVTYVMGEETREGFLPAGTNGETVAVLSNHPEIVTEEGTYTVLGWIKAGTTYVDESSFLAEMPAEDIELIPVTDFDIQSFVNEEAVEKEFNGTYGNEYVLSATAKGLNAEYTYEWYRAEGEKVEDLTLTQVADSGEYYVVVTDTLTGYQKKSESFTVTIDPAVITILSTASLEYSEGTAGTWADYTKALPYSAAGYTVRLKAGSYTVAPATLAEEAAEVLTIPTATQTNVGEYTYKVALAETDLAANYTLAYATGATEEFGWAITKATITVTDVTWTGAQEGKITFDYDGEEKTVEATVNFEEGNYAEYIDKTITSDPAPIKEPGDYTVTLTIALKSAYAANYVLEGTLTYTVNVTVEVEEDHIIDLTGATLTAPASLVYDGQGKVFTIGGLDAETLGRLEVVYYKQGETTKLAAAPVDAGNYTAQIAVTAAATAEGYIIKSGTEVSRDFAITPQEVTVTAALSATEFEADGTEKTVTVNVTPATSDAFTYTVTGDTAKTEAGTYTVTVTFTAASANYLLKINGGTALTVTLSWTIKEKSEPKPPIDDKENYEKDYAWEFDDVIITLKAGTLPKTYTFAEPKKVDLADLLDEIKKMDGIKDGRYDGIAAYEISLLNNGEAAAVPTGVQFTVKIKLTSELAKSTNFTIVHVKNGAVDTSFSASNTSETIGGNTYRVFTASSFSTYAVVGTTVNETGNWWLLIALIVIAVLLLIALILLIVLTVKVSHAEANVEEPAAEEVVEEETAEETEEVAEEEPVAEEVAEEEPAAEEEAPAEEAAAEEPAAEEEAPAEDLLAPEPTDDILGEEGMIAALVDQAEPPAAETMTVYDRSFKARLIQAEPIPKGYYNELKNYILSYKPVHARISWGCETFTKSREKICKLKFKGKSLYMYIALDPETLDAKYHHKNVSDVAKYASVPTLLKIRSNRALKYAKQLIDLVMQRLGVEQGEVENVDYTLNSMTTAELLEEGLVRKKEIAAPEFWNAEADDVLKNAPDYSETELPEEEAKEEENAEGDED